MLRIDSQSATRAMTMVAAMNRTAETTSGVNTKSRLAMMLACRSASTRPMVDSRAVSFYSDTKSLSSGGTWRRRACGSTT